jgi:hypothetical protein
MTAVAVADCLVATGWAVGRPLVEAADFPVGRPVCLGDADSPRPKGHSCSSGGVGRPADDEIFHATHKRAVQTIRHQTLVECRKICPVRDDQITTASASRYAIANQDPKVWRELR